MKVTDRTKFFKKMVQTFCIDCETHRKQADIEVKGLKVRSYLKEEQVDRKNMEKMIREIAKMRTDLQVDQMNYLLDLKELLTSEQVAKIESLKKEWRQ